MQNMYQPEITWLLISNDVSGSLQNKSSAASFQRKLLGRKNSLPQNSASYKLILPANTAPLDSHAGALAVGSRNLPTTAHPQGNDGEQMQLPGAEQRVTWEGAWRGAFVWECLECEDHPTDNSFLCSFQNIPPVHVPKLTWYPLQQLPDELPASRKFPTVLKAF